MPDQYFPGDLLLYKKLFGEQAIPSITYTNLKAPAFSNATLAGFNNRKISPLFYSGESQPLPDIDYEQWGLDMFLNSNQDKINRKLALKNSLASNAGTVVGAVATGAELVGDAINEGKGTFDLQSWKKAQSGSLADYVRAAGNANTTSDLLTLSDIRPDFIKKANDIEVKKYDVGKSLNAAGKGAMAGASIGSIIPGLGTVVGGAIGAGVGWLTNTIGQGFGIMKDNKDKSSAKSEAELLEDRNALAMNNGQVRVSNNIYRQGMANYLNNAAFGGPLFTHGSDFTDDLIRIDAGGTHEQNPFGGVPAGVDPQGIPNLVEEGEIIWDDYVFSDRLKMPKSLMKKYKLGGHKNKAISFAEGVDKISKKLGTELRPNDPITQNTKDEILGEFEEVQEEKRIKQQKKNLIKAMSEMTPEEFQAMMMPQRAPAEAPVAQEQMPLQGMEMQAPQEPVGLMAPGMAAFGGHILDGTKGESKRYVKRGDEYYQVTPRYSTDGKTSWDELTPVDASLFSGNLTGAGIVSLPDIIIEDWSKYNNSVHIRKDKSGNYWVDNRNVGKSYTSAQRAAQQMIKARRDSEYTIEPAVKTAEKPRQIEDVNIIYNKPVDKSAETLDIPYFASGDNPAWVFQGLSGRANAGLEGIGNSAVPQNKPTTQAAPKATTKIKSASTGAGVAKKAASTQAPVEWTPNKIFSISGINPVDQWRNQSIMFNPPAARSAVEKAVEGVSETDPEATVSVGAQENKLLPTWMRYAPLVGGGISLLSDIFSRPDYSGYEKLIADAEKTSSPVNIPVETIGARIRRNPYDERLAVNRANQNLAAGIRSTMDTAGGNRAYRQYASNLLAYNNQGQLSDIDRTAYLANRQDALQTADFNRQTDLYNMNAINQRNLTQGQLNANRQYQGLMAKAHLVDALENAKRYDDQLVSADFSTLMQNLHNLGNENFAFNQQAALAREGLDRLKYLGKSGNMVFNPEDGTWTFVAKCGGKVKTKKRRF